MSTPARGRVAAVAVHTIDVMKDDTTHFGYENRYVRAFLLPAIPAIGQEGSIVIPVGLYKASGLLEVVADGQTWQLRMRHVRQRGVDFDRVSYEKP